MTSKKLRLILVCGLVTITACQSTYQNQYPRMTGSTPQPTPTPATSVPQSPSPTYETWTPPAKTMQMGSSYIDRRDVQEFVNYLANKYRWNPQEIYQTLYPVQADSSIIKAVLPAPKGAGKNWVVYRSRFVEPVRIRAAQKFISEHHSTLLLAQQTYGVPAEIIAAIIGVETIYGRNMGNYSVLEALTNLAFDYPNTPNKDQRTAFFRSELENLFLLAKEQKQPIESYVGSYAGAIGLPQFMPSSIRLYAVDFDKDGHIDLTNSPTDAIGSVANFLKQHGWESGRPIQWRVTNDDTNRRLLEEVADGEANPKIPLGRLLDAGLTLDEPIYGPAERNTPVLIVDLPSINRPTLYRIGLKNFFVITRYNRSFFYAQSVYDLAQEIKSSF